MSIILNSSGGGSVTIAEPATASNFTATMPAANGTVTLSSDLKEIGVGQIWQDVSGSRTAGVTYTNSTGKPIMVSVRTTATATDFTITVDSIVTAQVTNIATTRMFMTTIVPNGSTYVVSGFQGGSWAELR
jgi:hypothetical protein